MRLSQLVRSLRACRVVMRRDVDVKGVTADSRTVQPGFVFVAIPGFSQDGHVFVSDAVRRGAAAVVVERAMDLPDGVAQAVVKDAREALSALSDRLYGQPSRKLLVCGVTGTKGKTTTTYLVRSICEAGGCPSGLMGTVAYRIGRREVPAVATTPEAPLVHGHLHEMVRAGLRAAVMEVSSHALVLRRVAHVHFRVAVLTNVMPHEHTDFHGSFEAYRAAKALLFAPLGKGQVAVLNRDDANFEYFRERTGAEVITYGMGKDADVRGRILESSMAGSRLAIELFGKLALEVRTPLFGRYNASNVLGAAAAAFALGMHEEAIERGVRELPQVPGRLEPVNCGQDFTVLVDYAHTADALRGVLETLRPLTSGRLIVVFGCGGNRDRTKRPLMGKVASELADFVWLTSDNSRNERTEDIVREIEAGLVRRDLHRVCEDRAEAIRGAIDMARSGDIVLLAGKGHETVQIIGEIRTCFDDRLVAREAIRRRMFREALPGSFSSVAAL